MFIEQYGWTVRGYRELGKGYPAGENLPLTDENLQILLGRGRISIQLHGEDIFIQYPKWTGIEISFEPGNCSAIISPNQLSVEFLRGLLKSCKSSLKI